jgi:hypothetical protein
MPATNMATVIGNLGLDCYHGCSPELHPAFLMALRIKPGIYGERWAFLADPESDEGFCSSRPHSMATTNRQIKFFIPREGATQATAYFTSLTEIHGRSSGTDRFTGEWKQWNWTRGLTDNSHVSTQLIPGQGVIVTLDLWPRATDDLDPTTTDAIEVGWVSGELEIVWSPFLRPGLSQLETDSLIDRYRKILTERVPPRPPWVRAQRGPEIEGVLRAVQERPAALERDAETLKHARRMSDVLDGQKTRDSVELYDPEEEMPRLFGAFLSELKRQGSSAFEAYQRDLVALRSLEQSRRGVRPMRDVCPSPSRVPVNRGMSDAEPKPAAAGMEVRSVGQGASCGHDFGGPPGEDAHLSPAARF